MRITLEEIIERYKKSNPNTAYNYGKTVLGQTLHDKVIITCPIHGDFIQAPRQSLRPKGWCSLETSYMEEDDIYFNNKKELMEYTQSKLDNIMEK